LPRSKFASCSFVSVSVWEYIIKPSLNVPTVNAVQTPDPAVEPVFKLFIYVYCLAYWYLYLYLRLYLCQELYLLQVYLWVWTTSHQVNEKTVTSIC